MSVSSSWDVSSDAELITAVRSGDAAAFGVLYERHAGAARAVAHQYSNSAADADDSVAEAFSRVFTAIQAGGGPDVAFRAYLFTVIRRVALHGAHSGRRTQTTDDLDVLEAAFGLGDSTEDPTFEGFERSVVSRAYKSLPERWQAVLWYTEVEQLSAAQIAPVLGLSANGVAALAYRAREGLRQAYLQQHLASPASEACTIVNAKLGAYVRGGLAKRETSLVESHLEECGDCRALVLELGDVNHGMRAVIAPLVLGAVAISVLHGVGFGGAIGSAAATAAGTGAAAGAGTGAGGAGTGAGTGGAAGSSVGVGSGSLVGAGAGASGLAGAGAVAGGAAALVAAGSQPAAAAPVPVAAGAGGASGATGLAALVGSVPVGAVGLAAAGLVVALAIGVSGMLGLFSGDDLPTVAGPEPVAEEVPEDLPGDVPDDESPPPDDTDDPFQVPGAPPAVPALAGPGFSAPETNEPTPEPTTPTPDPTTPPTTPPAEPPPPPPPADLIVASGFSGSTFVAGVPQTIETQIENPGSNSAGPVHTEFSFPSDSGVIVSALAAAPLGGPGAILAFAAPEWTCDTVVTAEFETVTCTIPEIGPGSKSTLRTTITLNDPVIDGENEIEIGTRAWAEPATPPAATPIPVRVASAPAALSVAGPAGLDSYVSSAAPRNLTFAVKNVGNTTATGLVAEIDLPAAVFWAGEVPGSDWACTGSVGANGLVTCTLDPGLALAPGATRDLVTRVRAQAGTERTIETLVEAANGRGGVASAETTTVVTVVTNSVAVIVTPTTITPSTAAPVPITILNLGDAPITNLQADIFPQGGALKWQAGSSGDGWTCWTAGGSIDISCQPIDRTLAPGATTTLYPQVLTPASPDGQQWWSTVRVMGAGMAVGNQVEETFAVTIRRTVGADGSAAGAYLVV